MKRALRISAGFMITLLVLGCHDKPDSANGGGGSSGGGSSGGGSAGPLAYASAADSGGGAAPAVLRDLTARTQSSEYSGPASDGGVDSGRELFDGARASGADLVAVSYTVPRRGSSSVASATPPSTLRSTAASRPRTRSSSEPPLPDDPALMRAAAESSGSAARGAGPVLLGFAADEIAQGYAAVSPILSRIGWGATRRRGAPIPMRPTHVTIHHTDGRQTMTEAETIAEVRAIQRFHMGPERGWDDIGYHFLIDGAGRVVEGRPAETLGAHVRDANENNIGIAMMGDFEKVHPTPAQVQSLERLVSYLAVKYKQDPAQRAFVQPHRHYGNTDCPGRNMMTIFETVRNEIDGETRQILARQNAEPGRFQPVAVVGA